MHQKLRYAQGASRTQPELDGFVNYHFMTTPSGDVDVPKLMLEKGINPAAVISAGGLPRRPVIGIRSSPWKAGHETNPWHDKFDFDNGHVSYFGDHKPGTGGMIGATTGNRVLLDAWKLHSSGSMEMRRQAPPLLLFRSTTVPGDRGPVVKGHVEFCGVAVIQHLEEVEQVDVVTGVGFPNLRLDLVVLDLADNDDALDLRWIDDRRDPTMPLQSTERHAPRSWRTWVERGRPAIPGCGVERPGPARHLSKDCKRSWTEPKS
ncbi:hypothetical protein ACFQY4_24460 [Catellatospora bangladeshensis]|uniref:hypothetical protein n=1 Tax=Catellatospora bangladeshensis TaxID=310355 RepID=UPI0036137F0F